MVEAHKQAKPEVNFPSYDRFFCQYMIDTYGSNYRVCYFFFYEHGCFGLFIFMQKEK